MIAGPYSIGSDVWPGLAKAAEECSELATVAQKIVASAGEPVYFDGTDLREWLADEIGDVLAAIDFVTTLCPELAALHDRIFDRMTEKRALFERWHAEQAS